MDFGYGYPLDLPAACETDAESRGTLERAVEFGVDLTSLISNLRLTPTERLREASAFHNSVVKLRERVAEAVSR